MNQILVTGASGRIGRVLRPALAEAFGSVRLFARSPIAHPGNEEEVFLGELEDLDSMVEACTGMTTIIHLGGVSDEAPIGPIVGANIVGTYNVFEAARRCGVRRVVYASTHHVTGYYPVDVMVSDSSPPRPDTLYAVSKVFGEALGRMYHDKWGIEIVCVRLGACSAEPQNANQLRTWLSMPDCVRLLVTAADCEVAEGYCVVYGASDNSRSYWDASESLRLGFAPSDSADDFVDRFPCNECSSTRWQGEPYTDPEYRGRNGNRDAG